MFLVRGFVSALVIGSAMAGSLVGAASASDQTGGVNVASATEAWLPPPIAPATDAAVAASAIAIPSAPAAKPSGPALGSTTVSPPPISVPSHAPTPSVAPAQPSTAGVAEAIAQQLAQMAAGKAAGDREAMVRFYAARDNAPLWVGSAGLMPSGEATIATFAAADAHGLSARDYAVPALSSAAGKGRPADASLAATELAITRAVLTYARDARGGRMNPNDLTNAIDRDPPLLAAASVLGDLAKADKPGAYLTGLHPRHPQFEKLRQAYVRLKDGDAASKAKAQRVLLNMEQWRWMPTDLGQLYVWANIPEFTLRVVNDGRVIHSERMITGKTDKQTPVFSDVMETIVFNPIWGVPDSIKVKEVLPSLLKGGKILGSHNLRIAQGGRDIDPGQVDWTKSDIRNFHVYQPPGGGNVLGVVKFLFPNKHQVYMHDTPTKNLFNAAQRTFSHGCMRVRDPLALATILLDADKGWPQSRIAALAKPGAGQNNGIPLSRKIPVHITYFTAFVDGDDKLEFKSDVYGHEKRIQMGLDGKAHLIPKQKVDLASARAEVIARLGEARQTSSYGSGGSGNASSSDWARRAFGSN